MLYAHIAAGVVSLITMVIAYTTKKGPKAHAKVGRIYGYGMIGVGLTAVILFFLGACTSERLAFGGRSVLDPTA